MTDIKEYTTRELVEELKKREGVEHVQCQPYEDYAISSNTAMLNDTGPAVILVVID